MSLSGAFRHRSTAAWARLLAVVVFAAVLVPAVAVPRAVAEAVAAAPAVGFTEVPSGASVGEPYTFSGTVGEPAAVAAVEVSTDGGALWRPAGWSAGATTWTSRYTPTTSGQAQLRVRALDAAQATVSTASATPSVAPRTCPCGLWGDTDAPGVPDLSDGAAVELGLKWRSSTSGFVRGVRFYKGPGNTGTHTGSLWSTTGVRLATGTFTNETAGGWQTLLFPSPVEVEANRTHVVSYLSPTGHFSADTGYFAQSARYLEPLTGERSTPGNGNGVFHPGGGFPDQTAQDANYWVDVVWATEPGVDTRAPALTGTSPVGGAGSVALSTALTASYDEVVDPAAVEFSLTGPAGPVTGSTTVIGGGSTARFAPSAALTASTTYTAQARVRDAVGNPTDSHSWVFTTGATRPAACPCTVWDDFATPLEPATGDPAAVELGVKVQFNGRGEVLGVRFYKGAGNTGTHTGSFWSSTGLLLATGTFADETTTGWQTLTFLNPVTVQANTTYVVSYFAPHGRYAVDPDFFRDPAGYGGIRALQTGVDGANGVFRYGGGFPTASHNQNNYWVDVIYRNGLNGDRTPPTLVAGTPATDATGVPVGRSVSLTYSEPIDPASPQVWLTDPGGVKLLGTSRLSEDLKTVVWTPNGRLAPGTRYTVNALAADVNGNSSATTSWSFTTQTRADCPCSLFSTATVPTTQSVASPVSSELGVRFQAVYNGKVTGVRFYKGAANTGTHTGTLWAANGTRLATGTFVDETTAGWQTLAFATPVDIRAGQVYVASYTAPNGQYALESSFFQPRGVDSPPLSADRNNGDSPNGVYATGGAFPTTSYNGNQYWVDVVFTFSGDVVPPVHSSHTPLTDATEVDLTGPVTASFDEPIDLTNTTVTVTDGGGARIAGKLTRTPDGHTVVWTPDARLSANTRHTVVVRAADETANYEPQPTTWRFTTTSTQECPCSLFSSAAVPDLAWEPLVHYNNVGIRFAPTVDGTVTGVKFHKTGWNPGPHTGSLWAVDGTRLATGTFTEETATGWQTLTFETPVPVTAGTDYVASYTPGAHPSRSRTYFDGYRVDSPPLTTPATGPTSYYADDNGMPTISAGTTNFWLDVVFRPTTR
ncbi:DUF4082 domain-containing protein [Actinosynnema sp. NPDC047251]|uniref:Ig-like domain-containing protein n=1 Tax=Saccharothrix espanaensis (strain ATCC 51144 / DSM 44229 / JCM 9112 / NBRC 15066 / NRRL 15764) TaxID=1179773 RepID=K0JZ69_SACES|nr:DUF4082 domain-containing protein [Saccharothrix espanaensis]CCH31426.1 hypothetical protein BN6_41390 [Saccharothrix espanaensis DSM 44229]